MTTNPFEDETGTYQVLVNDENQHSLWPADIDVPAGWRIVLAAGGRAECLAYVEAGFVGPVRQHRLLRVGGRAGSEDGVADRDALDAVAHLVDDPGRVDAGAGGQVELLPLTHVAGADFPVEAVHAGGVYHDSDLAGAGVRWADIDEPQDLGSAVLVELNGFHRLSSPCCWSPAAGSPMLPKNSTRARGESGAKQASRPIADCSADVVARGNMAAS
jgi:uncharacterized protein YbdZ (MbtH family)